MINNGDTAWVLVSSSLVMLMTPAVGMFYGGMVDQKNLLSNNYAQHGCTAQFTIITPA